MNRKDVYKIINQTDICAICLTETDLRYGVCIGCSDRVDGIKLTENLHKLWDTKNPHNAWFHCVGQ